MPGVKFYKYKLAMFIRFFCIYPFEMRKYIKYRITANIYIIILSLQLLNVVFYAIYTIYFNYLPTPFISDKNDTFMDFYHTAYWSSDPGRFTVWHSVYPPLVFLCIHSIMSFFPATELAHDGFSLRELWPEAQIILVIMYVGSIAGSIWLSPKRSHDNRKKIYWIIFFLISAPALFALERGNMIFTIPFLIAISIKNNGIIRSLSEAIMINIKPYMVVILFSYLVKRDLIGLIQTLSISLALFLVTGLLLDPNFFDFFLNFFIFSQTAFQWNPNSLMSMVASPGLLAYATEYRFAVHDFTFEFTPSDILLSNIPVYICYILAIIGSFSLLSRKFSVSKTLIYLFLISVITNCIMSAGGYSLVLYIPFIFYIQNHEVRFKYIYICLLVMFLPVNILITHVDYYSQTHSYISGENVSPAIFRDAATFLRPLANMVLLIVVVMEIRAQPRDKSVIWRLTRRTGISTAGYPHRNITAENRESC